MKTFKNLIIKISILMIILSVLSIVLFDHGNRALFGFKIMSVSNDEMSEVGIDHNDLVLIQEVDPSTIKEGDIITFRSLNHNNYFEVLTHKVRERIVDEEDYPGFVTYGTNNSEDDEKIVNYEYVLGKHAFTIKDAGVFFQFVKSYMGYICCIFVPFVILIFFFILSRVNVNKNNKNNQRKRRVAKSTMRIKVNSRVSHSNKEITIPKLNKSNELLRK